MNKILLYISVFAAGFSIMVLEITGGRLFYPFFGSSIHIWTSIITVTMASLSIGYLIGGKLADLKKHQPENIFYHTILAAGIVITLVPVIFRPIMKYIDTLNTTYSSLLSATAIFTAPLVLLSMTTPLSLKIAANTLKRLGVTSGNLYALATLGSLLGALASGFWLPNYFSAQTIIRTCGIFLILISTTSLILNTKKQL